MQQEARHIASGRHGSVYAVPSHVACGWSAVKIVHGPIGGRTSGSKPHDAVQEAIVLTRLRHPHIITLLGYKYDSDLHEHRYTLPFLPLSLSEILVRPLQSDLLRSIVFQSHLAIAHIHDLGIAHRDINPNNIMIDWTGTVKLIDFGLSWTGGDNGEEDEAWSETKEEMICDVGTGRWRAPELLFSPLTYDASALDLWAIGVVITDMFTPVAIPDSDSDSDSDDDDDPLDEVVVKRPKRTTLFDDDFGDIGLAGSIFRVLGTPTKESWPEFDSLPDAGKIDFITCSPRPLGLILPTMDQNLVDLTAQLLQLSPSRRIEAGDALKHAYFDEVLVPNKHSAWYGELRTDVSAKCVEVKTGKRPVNYLVERLEEKKIVWGHE